MFVTAELIAESSIDWQKYLTLTRQILGRSVSQGLDSYNMRADSLAAFICTLDEIDTQASDPVLSLRLGEGFLELISFTFLIVADNKTFCKLVSCSNIKFINKETIRPEVDLAIAHGTLAEWKNAILYLSKVGADTTCRKMANTFQKILESKGLQQVFSQYNKANVTDGTFLLLKKV